MDPNLGQGGADQVEAPEGVVEVEGQMQEDEQHAPVEEYDHSVTGDLSNYQLVLDRVHRVPSANTKYASYVNIILTTLVVAHEIVHSEPNSYKEAMMSKDKVSGWELWRMR